MMTAGPGTVASATSCPLSDLFGGVWEEKIEPLLRDDAAGKLKATTIIEWSDEQHPGRFRAFQLRTLRIASDQILLNFGRTRSPGGSSHEIREVLANVVREACCNAFVDMICRALSRRPPPY